MQSEIDIFAFKVFIIKFYLFIYCQFCQMTGSHKRTTLQKCSPTHTYSFSYHMSQHICCAIQVENVEGFHS